MKAVLRTSFAAIVLLAAPALASASGKTGYSGISGGTNCNFCHSGGTAPTVTLDGPTALAAGETASYSLTITGGAAVKGGFNVATNRANAVLTPGEGQEKSGGELTHSTAKSFVDGSVTFDFTLKAPPEGGGFLTLYGSGNSVNGDGVKTGDRAAATTLHLTIGMATSDGGMIADAGMIPPQDAGTETDAGSGEVADAGENPGSGEPVQPDPNDPGSKDEPSGGCAAAGVAVAPFLLAAWVLHLRRRARKSA